MARRWVWSFWGAAVGSLSEARTAVMDCGIVGVGGCGGFRGGWNVGGCCCRWGPHVPSSSQLTFSTLWHDIPEDTILHTDPVRTSDATGPSLLHRSSLQS
jgi:hypothetical protein